ncbi:Caffeoylshikimate esterase, partial [Cucurbita argyrosperma subsp. sororia]
MAAQTLDGIAYEEEYILNTRGLKLFTCKWIPKNQEPKGLIFICHGYAMECSITMNSTAVRLAKAGFAVHGIDYEGHGKSDGLQGYITSFDHVVDDCSNHFTAISEMKENKKKMRYLLGESMGGAVALLLHRKKPDYWDGAVLVAPMCKIAEDVKPSPIVVSILTKLCNLIPTWKIIPTQDIIDVAFKAPEIRHQIRTNPYCYKGRPRLNTGHELLKISLDLEQRLEEVSIPFMILHGEADRVTDISVSEQLHEKASSWDKRLKKYPEMWHGLLYGETVENIDIVFADIIGWLDERCALGNSRIEQQLKTECDDLQTK